MHAFAIIAATMILARFRLGRFVQKCLTMTESSVQSLNCPSGPDGSAHDEIRANPP